LGVGVQTMPSDKSSKSSKSSAKIQKKRRRIVLLLVFIIILVLFVLAGSWLFFTLRANAEQLQKNIVALGRFNEPGEFNTSVKFRMGYTPLNFTTYRRIMSSRNITGPYDMFSRGLLPSEYKGYEAIDVAFANPGFEADADKNDQPDNWNYIGMLEYGSKNCFEGKKCMHVDADNSNYSLVIFNSEEIRVMPGLIYRASFNINCVNCDNNSAYIGVFWMKYDNETYKRQVEFSRNIIVLNTTDGYTKFSIVARAPEGTEKAIFGVRVHEEGAIITPRTELFIDGFS